eukprot:8357-Ditylum_brightwellii.AAC.1
MLKALEIPWTAQHVKGHQSGKNMTWEAQLNNMADELATEARNSINPTMLKQVDLFPASKVSLIINGK